MPKAASQQKPILVSEDYDPRAWYEREAESEFESWAAVAQDLWGAGNFAPGQASGLQRAAKAVTIKRGHAVGAIGGALGDIAGIAAERGASIDVLDCDRGVLALTRGEARAAGRGKLALQSWNPARPDLKAGHYDSLIALRAFAFAATPERLCQALAAAVRPGGLLFVDELYAADLLVAALVARTTAPPGQKRFLHDYGTLTERLHEGGLELRSTATATDQILDAIKTGMARGQDLAQLLATIPEPYRTQRMKALGEEVQRATGLYQALDRGLATAIRTLHRKPRPA